MGPYDGAQDLKAQREAVLFKVQDPDNFGASESEIADDSNNDASISKIRIAQKRKEIAEIILRNPKRQDFMDGTVM